MALESAGIAPPPEPVDHDPQQGGLISSPVPGRTDRIPMDVPSGSYVIPADIVSGMGQGNTEAGAHIFDEMFAPHRARGGSVSPAIVSGDRGGFNGPKMMGDSMASAPYGAKIGARKPGIGPRMPAMNFHMPRPKAEGGEVGTVPIIVAGGEFLVLPEIVASIGGGDMDAGHKALDAMVLKLRKQFVEHTRKLPGPVKD